MTLVNVREMLQQKAKRCCLFCCVSTETGLTFVKSIQLHWSFTRENISNLLGPFEVISLNQTQWNHLCVSHMASSSMSEGLSGCVCFQTAIRTACLATGASKQKKTCTTWVWQVSFTSYQNSPSDTHIYLMFLLWFSCHWVSKYAQRSSAVHFGSMEWYLGVFKCNNKDRHAVTSICVEFSGSEASAILKMAIDGRARRFTPVTADILIEKVASLKNIQFRATTKNQLLSELQASFGSLFY